MVVGTYYIGPMLGYYHTKGPYNISYEAHKSQQDRWSRIPNYLPDILFSGQCDIAGGWGHAMPTRKSSNSPPLNASRSINKIIGVFLDYYITKIHTPLTSRSEKNREKLAHLWLSFILHNQNLLCNFVNSYEKRRTNQPKCIAL